MSAPAVIAITKLNFPETRESVTKRVEDVTLESGCVVNENIKNKKKTFFDPKKLY